MSKLTEEEEKAILNSAPKGTFALLLAVMLFFVAGWAAMYFMVFLARGPIS